jgi:hypothetical protein
MCPRKPPELRWIENTWTDDTLVRAMNGKARRPI